MVQRKVLKQVFRYQLWHLLSVLVLLMILNVIVNSDEGFRSGSLAGVNSIGWFWIAVLVPVLHQIYVWLVWRFELFTRAFSKIWGTSRAFRLYAAGFSVLFAG